MIPIIHKEDTITTLFCVIDDLYKHLYTDRLPQGPKVGRKATLVESELITIGIIFLFTGVDAFQKFYNLFQHTRLFGKLPEYSRLLRNVKETTPIVIGFLQIIMAMNRSGSDGKIKVIDSMPLPVVGNKRIFNYSVTECAKRGRSSMGWFYGFKMHIVVDEDGKLLRMIITPGNTSDKNCKLVCKLLKDLKGLALGDAGYVPEKIQKALKEQDLLFVTNPTKPMKKLATLGQLATMKLRQIVEVVNGRIKYRTGCVSSLPRSLNGYLWRYIMATFVFVLVKQFM